MPTFCEAMEIPYPISKNTPNFTFRGVKLGVDKIKS